MLPAYAGLADISISVMPGAICLFGKRCRSPKQKAVELNADSAEGHAYLGTIAFVYEWNFPEAERELRGAIALNPVHTTMLHETLARAYERTGLMRVWPDEEIKARVAGGQNQEAFCLGRQGHRITLYPVGLDLRRSPQSFPFRPPLCRDEAQDGNRQLDRAARS